MFVNTQFHEAVGSQNDWYEMIAGLRKFSFIRRDATAKVLSVHPFLPIILKERLLEWERAQWEERAVRAIHRILTRELLALQPCLVHLHCCILYVRARKMAFPEALALLDIYEQHGT